VPTTSSVPEPSTSNGFGRKADEMKKASSLARPLVQAKPRDAVPATAADAILGEPIIPLSVSSARRREREASLAPEGLDELDGESPEAMAAKDPLATHLWRVYAKAKSGLPNGARMENLTWRMMSLKLNKQRAAEAQAAAAAAEAQAQAQAEHVSPIAKQPHQEKAFQQAAAEEERGRRGRSIGNSASPEDDFADMDWRKQSRSRSRAPVSMAGGMDWRAQSRSRSRAPNARISLPRGGAGFQLPQYIESSESLASASRTDVYAYQPRSSTSATFPASPDRKASRQNIAPSSSEFDNYGSIEATLKQLIASTESSAQRPKSKSPPSARGPTPVSTPAAQVPTTPSTAFAYVAPTPLPTATTSWQQSAQYSQPTSFLPPDFSQPYETLAAPAQAVTADSSSSRSQDSISRSIEAYLNSLNYPSAHIDLHTQRHVGSIPGLFDEQGLKHNQHAEYGFLPKLVRKTSFDASYPAQLAQLQQKKQKKKTKASATTVSLSGFPHDVR
jgi:GATA-binding protein